MRKSKKSTVAAKFLLRCAYRKVPLTEVLSVAKELYLKHSKLVLLKHRTATKCNKIVTLNNIHRRCF